MKLLSSVVAVAILSAILPTQAQQRAKEGSAPSAPLATTDPLRTIYRISGVTDSGAGVNQGIATSFHCTNLSNSTQRVRYLILAFDGTVKVDRSRDLAPFQTLTASTHATFIFFDDEQLNTSVVNQGFALIQSTSLLVHCSAMIVDAAAAVPQGIALHMVRFNPAPSTQE